jgi:hypothetical protein
MGKWGGHFECLRPDGPLRQARMTSAACRVMNTCARDPIETWASPFGDKQWISYALIVRKLGGLGI